jgi:UDP-2,4-diacetamido-2,4,6-trideoxy-beta-L-altropyranose hydrolase
VGDVLSGRHVHLVAASAPAVGGGHVSRSLALAEALIDRGAGVSATFLGGALRGEAARQAARLGLADGQIPSEAVVVADLARADDAIRLADAARLVIFDDRNAFSGAAAIVIQPSLPRWSGPGHGDRVLAGFGYVPLAPRYRELRDERAALGGAAASARPHVVLCFGGSDPELVTERLAPALLARADAGDREPAWTVELIVGAGHRPDDPPDLALVRDPSDLPERLAAADLAVIAAGTMKFEVACLGRPAILVGVADDQLPVGPAFAATGAAEWLGDGRHLDPERLGTAVADLVGDPDRRRALGRRGSEIVDGRGADRLATAILEIGVPDDRRAPDDGFDRLTRQLLEKPAGSAPAD